MIIRDYCEICKEVTDHYRFESVIKKDVCLNHNKADVYLCMEKERKEK